MVLVALILAAVACGLVSILYISTAVVVLVSRRRVNAMRETFSRLRPPS